jgi:5-methyltetrahydropteroyltriglutamate--homocysteine methyltransferase
LLTLIFVKFTGETSNGLSKDEIYDLVIKTANYALQKKSEDMIITMHLCRGNFRSTHIHGDGDYEYHYDGLFLEYENERSGRFEA